MKVFEAFPLLFCEHLVHSHGIFKHRMVVVEENVRGAGV